MNNTEILTQMKKLNDLLQDYLDRMDMADADDKECKKESTKKGKED